MATSIADSPVWGALLAHVDEIKRLHLRDLLADESRCASLIHEVDGLYCDFSRQNVNMETMKVTLTIVVNTMRICLAQSRSMASLASCGMDPAVHVSHLPQPTPPPTLHDVCSCFKGLLRQLKSSRKSRACLAVSTLMPQRIERCCTLRCVLGATRRSMTTARTWSLLFGRHVGQQVLDKIKWFSERVREGHWTGVTGKALTNVVAIGIGGSFLGPLFVHTALETEPAASLAAAGRQLRFLANVDPIDVAASLRGLDPASTLVVVVSKTFTTAETMLNARTVRKWLQKHLGERRCRGDDCVARHMVAVSTNEKLVTEFGISADNMYGFWDWVGGRFSVCSAVGMLPLSLQYGFDVMQKFLERCCFRVAYATVPTTVSALSKFAPHVQQVSMESNGKGVDLQGQRLPFAAGEIDFGEPGTNGQHSFYQLIHQGRIIPCDFIGISCSQQGVALVGETVCNHDELMCNFFAQADALAYGKTPEELHSQGVTQALVPHKTFEGNRPSLSLLLPECSAYTLGQLLSLYEHRIAVQGFVWGINSFDQWGVELGKVLATKVRTTVADARKRKRDVTQADGFSYSTVRLLNKFLQSPVKHSGCAVMNFIKFMYG
eukprot:303980-Chlamydomonas_euryale.AAC.26